LFEGCFGVEAEPEAISAPTLLIHGSLDVISPVGNAESLASRIPTAELVVIDGAGHVPTVTRPHQLVDIIEDWMRRIDV